MPTWLKDAAEWYLGVRSGGPGEDTRWQWQTAGWFKAVPGWIFAIAVIGVVVGVILVYRRDARSVPATRRWLLTFLRLSTLGLVLVLLMQVSLSIDRTGLPSLVVMIDHSASMHFQDDYTDTPDAEVVEELLGDRESIDRLDITKALLTRDRGLLEQLAGRYQLRVYRFSGEAESVLPPGGGDKDDELIAATNELKASGQETALTASIRQVLNGFRGSAPTAVVLLTDGISSTGIDNRLSQFADSATQTTVPLYIVGTGSTRSAMDIELTDVRVDEVAIVNESVLFTGDLRAEGFEGREVVLEVRDAATDERVHAEAVTVSGSNQSVELTFVPETAGEFDFTFGVVPLDEEHVTENNSETRHVSVREGRIRVLLVDTLPRYEFRYVKHLLERSASGSGGVELHTILFDADPQWVALDASAAPLEGRMPATADALNSYDVVVLGDVDPDLIGAGTQRLLRDFVRDQGGGLVLIAGPKHNPHGYRATELEPLVPVELDQLTASSFRLLQKDGVTVEPTLSGRRGTSLFRFGENEADISRVIAQFPNLLSVLDVDNAASGVNILATSENTDGSTRPIIVSRQYGAGKVVLHATDDLWMWRYRAGDETYGRYWTSLIRYLSRSSLLGRDRTAELMTDRESYERGTEINFQLRFLDSRAMPKDGDVTLTVERRKGASRVVTMQPSPTSPDTYTGTLAAPEDGTYHAWVSKPTFEKSPPTADFRVQNAARELLVRQMDVVGMKAAAKATRGRYYTFATSDRLATDLPRGRQTAIERGRQIPLWSRPELLLLIAILLAAEWFLRKSARLI